MGLNDKQIQSKWYMKSDVFTMTVKFSMKGQIKRYSFHIYMIMIFREYILYIYILLTWLLTYVTERQTIHGYYPHRG